MNAKANVPSESAPLSESRILLISAILAAAIEFIALTLAGVGNHWMVHKPAVTTNDESRFVEAQMLEVPEEAHLVSQTPSKAISVTPEAVLSKKPGEGRKAKPGETSVSDVNQTKSVEQTVPPNHGPVAVFTPAPVIPPYLQSQELNASVVIEFLVSSRGVVTPRLLASSGNEELDAIALNTAQKWQFRPAEQNHVATDSKVRLRIVFEVK